MTAGRSDPSGEPSGDFPGSGDQEFGSTVFDESFIRSAELEEFSARQRLEEHSTPVRKRAVPAAPPVVRPRSRAVSLMVTLVAAAVVVAMILSNDGGHSGGPPADPAPPPAAGLLPLQPEGEVPGGPPARLYEESPAAGFGVGADGLHRAEAAATEHFTSEEVAQALELAERYVVASTLTPNVLSGETALPVRGLLRDGQRRQLDAGLAGRSGGTPASAWLLRLDPERTELADTRIRTDGHLTAGEAGGRLEVAVEQLAAYAVRPVDHPGHDASLLLVRRETVLAFTEEDLQEERVVVVSSETALGPVDCGTSQEREIHPLPAGARAAHDGTGVNLFDTDAAESGPCATLTQPVE